MPTEAHLREICLLSLGRSGFSSNMRALDTAGPESGAWLAACLAAVRTLLQGCILEVLRRRGGRSAIEPKRFSFTAGMVCGRNCATHKYRGK